MNRHTWKYTGTLLVGALLSVPAGFSAAAEDARTAARKDAAKPVMTALSDVLGIEPPDADECPKTRVTRKAAAPGLEQAVGDFNAALEGSVSPQAMRALEASPAWRDPALASKWAAAALIADKPLAAAALAVRAHRSAPREPLYLSNLAAVANGFGRHDEALAFANAAEALTKDGAKGRTTVPRANVLTNKANALIGLDRAPEAEAVLKEAIRLQPDLSEAYTNMAYALGHQKRCAEAAKYLGAGGRRKPAETVNPPKEEDPGKKPPETGQKETAAEREEAPEEEFLPGDLAFDLRRGKRGLLPKIPVPLNLEKANATLKLIEKLQKKLDQETKSLMPGLQAAIEAQKRREAKEQAMEDSGDLSQRLSAERSRRLRQALSRFARDGRSGDPRLDRFRRMMRDSYADMSRAGRKASERKGEADAKALAKFVETQEQVCTPLDQEAARVCGLLQPGCEALRKKATACAEKAKWDWQQAQCKSATKYLEETASAVRAYDNWLRSYFHESYLYATAVASYLGERDNQTWARFKLRGYELQMFGKALLAPGVVATDEFLKTCKAAPPSPPPLDVPVNDVAFCVLPEGTKAKASVADAVEVAMNCEQVAVKVSPPGPLDLFIQVEYDKSERKRKMADEQARKEERRANRNPSNPLGLRDFGRKGPERIFDGELTVFVGSGVKTPSVPGVVPIETEVQAGGFIKVGHYGGVVDFGTKTASSTSVGASAGVVSVGIEMDTPLGGEVGFVSAPAPAK
jgi:tetratricopeptide (TPR) repeat protein